MSDKKPLQSANEMIVKAATDDIARGVDTRSIHSQLQVSMIASSGYLNGHLLGDDDDKEIVGGVDNWRFSDKFLAVNSFDQDIEIADDDNDK